MEKRKHQTRDVEDRDKGEGIRGEGEGSFTPQSSERNLRAIKQLLILWTRSFGRLENFMVTFAHEWRERKRRIECRGRDTKIQQGSKPSKEKKRDRNHEEEEGGWNTRMLLSE